MCAELVLCYYSPISLISVMLWTASARYYLILLLISTYHIIIVISTGSGCVELNRDLNILLHSDPKHTSCLLEKAAVASLRTLLADQEHAIQEARKTDVGNGGENKN